MQRVHRPVVRHGADRGDEGLAGDLAAEDALPVVVGRAAAEDVDLDALEVEQVDELLELGAHARSLRRRSRPSWTMVATRRPSCVQSEPRHSALPLPPHEECWS